MDDAVKTGDFEALKAAIREGGDVNGRYKRTDIPYLLVVFGNWSSNVPNRAWGSWECIQNRVKMAKFLISHGADTNVKGSHCETPLYWACKWQNYDVVKQLIDHGAKANLVEDGYGLRNGYNPLMVAAEKRKPEIVQLLIEYGADVNIRDRNKENPLHAACRFARHENAKVLIEHGADLTLQNISGHTPLDLALAASRFDSGKEAIYELYQRYAPDVYFSTFCTTPSPGGDVGWPMMLRLSSFMRCGKATSLQSFASSPPARM